jgi:hypothetical protein
MRLNVVTALLLALVANLVPAFNRQPGLERQTPPRPTGK